MRELVLESKLYKRLDRLARSRDSLALELRGLIDSSLGSLDEVLAEVRRYFFTYTDHAITHSGRVVANMSNLLSSQQVNKLSSVELYLLIASALVHDIGMVVSERDVEAIVIGEEYQAEKAAVCAHLGIDPTCADERYGLFRMVVAEYIRKRHGKRCVFFLEQGLLGCRRLTGGDDELTRKLASVCVGHTLTREELASSGNYPTNVQVRNQSVNVLFCTILLRLGDLLDLATARASPVIRELSEPLEPLSASHWDQYKKIEIGGLGPKRPIFIGGTCPTQAAERLLREWVQWLEDECEWAVLILHAGEEQHYLHLGRVTYDVRPESGLDGQPLYEFHNYRFNLDEEQVFRKLFGQRLYGRQDAALRELIQNALDATRVRAVLACSSAEDWATAPEREKRARYLAHLHTHHEAYTLRVELSTSANPQTGIAETWLTVSDSGVGMSREVIEKYLLKVGRSRWRDDPRTRSLGIGTIGEFGIGFISAFMISDRIQVDTQSSLPNESGIRAVIYSWKGYLATEPIALNKPGTSVRLLLKPDAVERLHELVAVVEYWCPFPEVPIEVRTLDGTIHLVPVRGAKGYSKEERRIYFRIGDGFSFASISEDGGLVSASAAPTLAQEGIAIPDMPPPVVDAPEQRILRERGLRVNLFGNDITRLDLSRNLTEGGYEQLWKGLVPLIWRGLARDSVRTRAGGTALAEFVQKRFELSEGTAAFILLREQDLWSGELISSPTVQSLTLVDHTSPYFNAVEGSAENLLILPDIPHALLSGIDVDAALGRSVDECTKYWASLGGHLSSGRLMDEDEDEFFEPGSVESDHSVRPPTIGDLLVDPVFDGFEDNTPASILVFRRYYHYLFGEYRFVSQSRGGFAQFHRDQPPVRPSHRLEQLGLFRLTTRWWAIRNPISGLWLIVSNLDFQIAEDGIPPKRLASLSYEQLATAYLYDLWPETEEWKNGWPWQRTVNFGEAIYKALDKVVSEKQSEADALDEETDQEGDDEDEETFHINFERRIDLSPNEIRRIDRHGVEAAQSHTVLAQFVNGVLHHVDSSCLASCLTDWDRQAWLARRARRGGRR
jgi:hypothetical protein